MRIGKLITIAGVLPILLCGAAVADDISKAENNSFLEKLFSKDKHQFRNPGPGYNGKIHDRHTDRHAESISAIVDAEIDALGERENDPVERYPEIPGYLTIKNSSQKNIETLIETIYSAYDARIGHMDPPDLRSSRISAMGSIPTGYPTIWKARAASPVWHDQRQVVHSVEDIYRRALEHSNQIKVYSDLPLIRETGMQEADGEFDITTFIDGRLQRGNEPIGSTLTTGNLSNRFRENRDYLEGGVRKKFATGAEVTMSNRISTLSNNSSFLVPQNQGSSEFVLSVVQPLLQGSGYHYNQSKIKLAKFDSRMASAEFVRQLQSHLLEVNRAYWALYYARSYYLLSRDLVGETGNILSQLEQRSDLDALQSEVLRARSSLAMRKSMLNRAEMAVRNSEERLRALVNDPDQDIGSNAEMIPTTPPIMTRYVDSVKSVAKDALRNRPEVQQAFDELRAAIVRRDMQKNNKWPTLNLVAEMMMGDIEGNDAAGRAFKDQWEAGTGYLVGFEFEQPWDNDADRARLLRSEFELRQQVNQLRATIDVVLLEALVSYRELMTAYRDMQGRYSALRASREETRQLRDRLEVDTEEEGGRTTASQLQLILDSMDRNQNAEELFLDSVVAYNASFAALQRARGTFLRSENVEIKRIMDTDPAHPGEELEKIHVSKPANITSTKGGKSYPSIPDSELPSYEDSIPDVPEQASNGEGGFSVLAEANSMNAAPAPEVKEKKGLFSNLRKANSGGNKVGRSNTPAPSVSVKPVANKVVSTPVAAPVPVANASSTSGESSEFATNTIAASTFSSVPRTKPIPVIETPAVMARSLSGSSVEKTVTVTPQASAKPLD